MLAPRTGAIARHVDAARSLLRELELQAESALNALGRDQNDEFFAAVDDRTRTLDRLDRVIRSIMQQRAAQAAEQPGRRDPAAEAMIAEVAQATTQALESHARLAAETRRERDRLAQVHARSERPDSIAHRYAAMSSRALRPGSLSVSG